MAEPLRETCLKIGFDGDRVGGSLCDEHGSIRTFSGWLDLIGALMALRSNESTYLARHGVAPSGGIKC